MPTILFFDDWPIQEQRGLDRRWFQAEPWPGLTPATDPMLQYSFGCQTVIRDPKTGRWRMWASGMIDRTKGDSGFRLFAYDSEDGLHWQPLRCEPPADRRATPMVPHLVFSGEHCVTGACPFLDEREPNPMRRYKIAYSDYQHILDPGACRIAVSPDGLRWTSDTDAIWRQQVVDTAISIAFNPYTNRYQFTARPLWGDRRVALYQTDDWKHFDDPQVVLHPDPADPPCVEFYGMPHCFYEGYFIGILWRQHGAYDDIGIPPRLKGRVDAELAYSINGTNWNRGSRTPLLSDRGLGGADFRSEYPTCPVLDDDGWLRIYAASCTGEHDDWFKFKPHEPIAHLTIHRIRRDGFCALETHSDRASLVLRSFIALSGEIRLNAMVGRFGRIRGELRTVPENKPFEGYEMENCLPVTGDGHFLVLRWKDRPTIESLAGQPFRLFLELEQARLYAIRLDADYLFSCLPHKTITGDYYVPEKLIGFGEWTGR